MRGSISQYKIIHNKVNVRTALIFRFLINRNHGGPVLTSELKKAEPFTLLSQVIGSAFKQYLIAYSDRIISKDILYQ